MAKIFYNWGKVKRGDIVSFKYRSKDGRFLKRSVLVLEPKLKNEAKNPSSKFLLHGIQLEVSNKARLLVSEIRDILLEAGDVEVVSAKSQVYRVELEGKTQMVYKRLKDMIKKYGNFRTFSYDKIITNQVFLEDVRLPRAFIRELAGEN